MLRKTFSMLIAVSVTALSAFGQTEKGTTLLGASFTTKFAKHRTPLIDGTLRGGYFFKNNLMIGLESNFNHFRVKSFLYTNSEISAGLLGRYYINIKESRFRPFVEAGGGAARSWGELKLTEPSGEPLPTTYSGNFFYMKYAVGASYQLSRGLSLEATLDRRIYPFISNPYGESHFRVGLNFHLPSKSNK